MVVSGCHLNLSLKISSYHCYDNIDNQIFWSMQEGNGYDKTKQLSFGIIF